METDEPVQGAGTGSSEPGEPGEATAPDVPSEPGEPGEPGAPAGVERATIGRRGLMGAVVGAAAAGVVGVQVLRDDGDRRDAARPDDGGDPDPPAAIPPPAEPDRPPARVAAATVSSTVERRHGGIEAGNPLARLHDLRAASEVVDDFVRLDPATSVPFGWELVAGGPGATAGRPADQEGGSVRLVTGRAPTGRAGLRLGPEGSLGGAPPFTMEWRLSIAPVPEGGAGGLVVGYLATVGGGGRLPDAGVYFACRSDLGDTWLCACAGAGGRTLVDSGVPIDPRKHRFQVTCDGTGTVRFAIDDVHVALVASDVPTADDRYALGVELFSSAGEEPLVADLDWVYVRRELVR